MATSPYLFNVDSGYLEGLVRGFRRGILTRSDYLNLIQCETLDGQLSTIYSNDTFVVLADLKLHLAGSDYGNFLANEGSPLAVATIDDRLRERLVLEFRHLRNQALKPLSDFMDYIMLVDQDNVFH